MGDFEVIDDRMIVAEETGRPHRRFVVLLIDPKLDRLILNLQHEPSGTIIVRTGDRVETKLNIG